MYIRQFPSPGIKSRQLPLCETSKAPTSYVCILLHLIQTERVCASNLRVKAIHKHSRIKRGQVQIFSKL